MAAIAAYGRIHMYQHKHQQGGVCIIATGEEKDPHWPIKTWRPYEYAIFY